MTPDQFARSSMTTTEASAAMAANVPTPRIVLKLISVLGCFVEKDQNVHQMGGCGDPKSAMELMLKNASNFFNGDFSVPKFAEARMKKLQESISKHCRYIYIIIGRHRLISPTA